MFLESIISIVLVLVFFGLIVLIYFLMRLRNKRLAKLIENGAFIESFFASDEKLRADEYLPSRNKPVNRLKDQVFMAKTFILYATSTKVYRINYSDIYWAYGEVSKKNSKMFNFGEAFVVYTINGKHHIYVKKQDAYINYLASLGIPCGYQDKVKVKALEYKKKLEECKKNDKK